MNPARYRRLTGVFSLSIAATANRINGCVRCCWGKRIAGSTASRDIQRALPTTIRVGRRLQHTT